MRFTHFVGSNPPSGRGLSAGRRACYEYAALAAVAPKGASLLICVWTLTAPPDRVAFVVQIRSTSRAGLGPDAVLVVDHNGKVIEGDGQPPNALPIIS
jgi:hypothetical protein